MLETFPLQRRFIAALSFFCLCAILLTFFVGSHIASVRKDQASDTLKHRTNQVAFVLKEAAEDTRRTMRDAAVFSAKKATGDDALKKILDYFREREMSAERIFSWEYLAWFDADTGALYATEHTDPALLSVQTLSELVAKSTEQPYALIIGKTVFGATGNTPTLPAALTVQDGKGNTLGTLIAGLNSQHLATDILKRISPDSAMDIAILDQDFFIVSAVPHSVTLRNNGVLLRTLQETFGSGDVRSGVSDISALSPEKPKFRFERSEETPFYIVAGLEGTAIFDTIWAPVALSCLAIIVFAGMSVVAALHFRKRALVPLQELAYAAERISEGKAPGAIPSASLPESAAIASQLRKVVRYHKELRESRDALEESHALVKSALRYITHELKTPLTQILGFSEILINGAGKNLPESHKEYIRLIHEAARMQHTLIGSFTEQIREQEGGAEDLRAEECDLHEVTEYYVAIFAGRASDKNVSISVEAEPDLPSLYADQGKLGNVILNLASNAIKYNVNEGHVVFRIRQSRDGRYLNLCCEDTGIGMEKEDIKKIFKPFTRLFTARTAHIDGAGLGLSYIRRIVSQHGGYVTVESEPGKGSRFTCHFPLVSQKHGEHTASAHQSSGKKHLQHTIEENSVPLIRKDSSKSALGHTNKYGKDTKAMLSSTSATAYRSNKVSGI